MSFITDFVLMLSLFDANHSPSCSQSKCDHVSQPSIWLLCARRERPRRRAAEKMKSRRFMLNMGLPFRRQAGAP
jgi:hypothetical protein